MSQEGTAGDMGGIMNRLQMHFSPISHVGGLDTPSIQRNPKSEAEKTRLNEIKSLVRIGIQSFLIGMGATFTLMRFPQPTSAEIDDAMHARSPVMAPALVGIALMSEATIQSIDEHSVELAESYIAQLEHPQSVVELQNFIETGIYIDLKLRAPSVTDSENTARIPLVEILQRSLELYGQPITWTRSDDALEHSNVIKHKVGPAFKLAPITLTDILGYLRGETDSADKIHHLKNLIIQLLGPDMAEANEGYVSFSSPADPRYSRTSGFAQRISDASSKLEMRYLDKPRISDTVSAVEIEQRLDQGVIDEMNDVITQLAHNDGSRIQTAEVIAHFLRINDGNLNNALDDTSIFYKLLARGYRVDKSNNQAVLEGNLFVTNAFKLFEDNFSIFAQHFGFPDEKYLEYDSLHSNYKFQQPSGIRKNYETLNLVGTPYHILGMLSLLQKYDPDTIRLAVIGQQLVDFGNQGHAKTLADFVALDQLPEVLAFLEQVSHQETH